MKIIKVGINNKYFNNTTWRNMYPLYVQPFVSTLNYFSDIENIYFLIISIFQLLTYDKFDILPSHWSPTGPFSTTIPLLICLLIQIISDIYKWMRLAMEDYKINNSKYKIWNFKTNNWDLTDNKDIYPGNIIMIDKDSILPIDGLLLDHFEIDFCKCSLSNLNGESNITTVNKCDENIGYEDYNNSLLTVENDLKTSIFDINGNITLKNNKNMSWNETMFLVNGSKLVSNGAVAIVINCGNDKKLGGSNDKQPNNKFNSVMSRTSMFMMNYTIYVLIFSVIILSLHGTINKFSDNFNNIFVVVCFFILNIIQKWILLNGIIPFSIKILLHFLKIYQSNYLSKLLNITINNSNVVDQFGFIDRIFSDKTGTITKNCLELVSVIDEHGDIYSLDCFRAKYISAPYIPTIILKSLGLSIGFQNS
jgi:magnesium-transporting ATPase (P-type)